MSDTLAIILYFVGCLLTGIAGAIKFYIDDKKRMKEKCQQEEKNNSKCCY